MARKKFKTSSNAHEYPKTYEPVNDIKLVETGGYLTTKQRIENITLAGQRLLAHRKEQYDFPEGKVNEEFEDPTRNPSFDEIDATIELNRQEILKKEASKKKETKKKAEASEKNLEKPSEQTEKNDDDNLSESKNDKKSKND